MLNGGMLDGILSEMVRFIFIFYMRRNVFLMLFFKGEWFFEESVIKLFIGDFGFVLKVFFSEKVDYNFFCWE